MSESEFTNVRTALVTGCSSGIGFHVALELAQRGYTVFACARKAESMASLKERFPQLIITFSMDVSDLESVKRGYQFVKGELDRFGSPGLDILYNNAGSSCTFPGVDVPDNALVQCMATNFEGPVRVTHEFSRLVIKKKGTFAYTGSAAGYCPFPWGSVYGASKAAIGQYCNILAFELEPFGCKVKNFITGGVKTNIADKRPLPEDSIYNIEPMRRAFEERQKFAERNNPMLPEVYAKRAIDEIEANNNTVDVYLGTWSILPYLCRYIVPRFIILMIFRVKFHLVDVFRALSQSSVKDKSD